MAAKKTTAPRYGAIFRDDPERVEMARLFWAEITQALEATSAATPVNLVRADRYVRARVEYESLYPVAAEAGPVKVGPNGGDVFSFEWSAVEKLNERMMKLERAMFGEATSKSEGEKPAKPPAAADGYLARIERRN